MIHWKTYAAFGLLNASFSTLSVAQKIEPVQYGNAVVYSQNLCGKHVSAGGNLNCDALTAAHRSLPFGTQVRVTNLKTEQSVILEINDRGPYSGKDIIDLSPAAAKAISLTTGNGRVSIRMDVLVY
jgi:rare lipoprotein A